LYFRISGVCSFIAYRDKKVVGVFVDVFRVPLQPGDNDNLALTVLHANGHATVAHAG
jgi:hypothetical protein